MPSLTVSARFFLVTISLALAPAAMAERAAPARGFAGVDDGRQSLLRTLSGTYLAARSAAAAQDVAAAAQFFDSAYRIDPANNELLARAFLLRLSAGDIGRASELATLVMERDPSDRLSRLVLAVRSMRNQRYASAQSILSSGDKGGDVDITAGLLAAWAAQGAGQTQEALTILTKLKGAEFYDVFRDYHGGLINDVAARRTESAKGADDKRRDEVSQLRAEASRRIAAAYRADPYGLRLMEAQARLLARNGERDQALVVLDNFLSRAPENPIAKALKQDIAAKKPIAPMIRDARRGAAEVLLGLGSALARDDGQDIAAIYFNLATYLDDDNALALLSLGDLMDQMKRTERAVALYERVPRTSPMRRSADLQQALALDDLARTDDALLKLDRIIAANPNDVDALVTRANILRIKKRWAEAITSYDAAIALVADPKPRHWTWFFSRATCLERDKKWDLAERDLKKALELQPERPEVLNYLGYSWVDRHLNLTEALAMLHRAVELRPEDGAILDSVGWAYYRLGNYNEALIWLEKAIERMPGDPVINDHLGDVYFKLGRVLEARFQWSHARDLKPEEADLAVIVEKLRTGELPAAEARPATGAATPTGQGG
ncbi:tetratricopeptide repeat protein [Candidatus Raskinella chloraquaticus]|uniref:Bacterial transcriptional activator domain-containing protein n=1 Tax=Candidatus Raskinella chloraquaticus TaxID=1951219 RepID=A0A1W9HWL2_9HYPH|nr:MAG: hypothetical protein A4S15_10350 [Proteobacteria bacterium SG_bin8]